MNWLDTDDFPSGPGGSATDFGATWVHPVTQVVYFWNNLKNSWMTLNSPGARIYTDTVDPALSGIVLQDGDLWWDAHHLELRVYHKPLPLSSGDDITGRWVSSTNPEMTPEDANRNMIIGTIIINGVSSPYEDIEYEFSVERPYGGAPESKIQYEWRSSPPDITVNKLDSNGQAIPIPGTDPVEYEKETFTVQFFNPNSRITNVLFPKGTAVFDGNYQVSFNVNCRISAAPGFEDEFVNEFATSPSIRVLPIPAVADPVQYINAGSGLNSDSDEIILHSSGSEQVNTDPDTGFPVVSATLLTPNFFIVPSNRLNSPIDDQDPDSPKRSLVYSTKPKDSTTVNTIVSTYIEDYGPIVTEDGNGTYNATGYLLQISQLNLTDDVTLYVWDEEDPDLQGTLILRP